MTSIIKIENLSKQYQIGLVSTKTLTHDLNRWWAVNILGKDDPYLKVGETNNQNTKGESEYIWALKDININVQQGEALGIIGKNGAGKSTLLKIISKVTAPTTGTIKARGRIASLLEIGTGFHPEMTGRENIFMNGAIMGMTKSEITRKFDEIIDFSGVERYIDTPVKRYSSGMTVRLGFAVAAHLEPEILVVDEVLAVGDSEFQRKAIGKMQEVSNKVGRTILFVSHNLGAVRDLCKNTLLLENGYLTEYGNSQKIIEKYIGNSFKTDSNFKAKNLTVKELYFEPQTILSNKPISFSLKLHSSEDEVINSIGFLIYNQFQQRVAIIDLRDENGNYNLQKDQELCLRGTIEHLPLVEGIYKIGIFYGGIYFAENIFDLSSLSVLNDNSKLLKYPVEVRGYVNLNYKFSYEIN